MVPDVGHDMARAKLIGGGREIAAEMAAEETEQQIDRAVEDEHPGHQEMPVAREREVGTPQRQPSAGSAPAARTAVRRRRSRPSTPVVSKP